MLSRNRIKYIQSLSRKKQREEHQSFIAETPKVVNEFLNSSYKVKSLFAEHSWLTENNHLIPSGTEVTEIDTQDLGRISQLKSPHSVLAILEMPDESDEPSLNGKITIALDDLQDPGNFGTIIRIADWFGIENILCNLQTANAYNPKVVQASMGSLAHVRVHYTSLEDFLKQAGLPVYATGLTGKSVYEIGKLSEAILVIGNEGRGITESINSLAQEIISIPRLGRAESLNAAIATGIIVSHLTSKQ